MRAHDEALDRLAIPFTSLADFICEALDLGYAVENDGFRLDKAPFLRKCINLRLRQGLEGLDRFVETVQMQARLLGRISKNMFFERVITQL